MKRFALLSRSRICATEQKERRESSLKDRRAESSRGSLPLPAERSRWQGDYRTTRKYCTVLALHDTAAAIHPSTAIARQQRSQAATGTSDSVSAQSRALPNACHLLCHHLERKTVIFRNTPRRETTPKPNTLQKPKTPAFTRVFARFLDQFSSGAKETRTLNP